MSLVMPPAPAARLQQRTTTCSNCKSAALAPDGQTLECRFNPPTATLIQGKNGPQPVSFFPLVQPQIWCERHRPRIEIASQINGG